MQVVARLGVGGNLTVESLVVHRGSTSAELNGDFPHFIHSLHGQRARECKGDCNKKRGPDQLMSRENARKN